MPAEALNPGSSHNIAEKEQKKANGVEYYTPQEGPRVALKWNIFTPHNNPVELKRQDEAVLFLPGVAVEADSSPVQQLAQDYADAGRTIAYSISTRIDNPKTDDSQSVQAEAICQFIMNQGLREVRIVGNSQGAKKAVYLGAELKRKGVHIGGIILTAPAGLQEQSPKELAKNFFKDALVNTPVALLQQDVSRNALSKAGSALKLGASVIKGIAGELLQAPGEFAERVSSEAKEAAAVNVRAEEIDVPVVVLFGSNDKALGAHELIPEAAHVQSSHAQTERIKTMKKIFPNSPHIKVLEAGKLGIHGFHYLRSKQIAKVTLGILDRFKDQNK